jgi:HPt (histidine-containing phosphotransfer) domain-containing protein
MNDDVIDLKEALERVQDDRELLLELFEIFLGDCPKKLEIIRQAAEKKDLNQLKDAAHSLKGASGNFSAKRIYNSFLSVEQISKAGELQNIPNVLSTINEQMAELREYVQKLKKEKF